MCVKGLPWGSCMPVAVGEKCGVGIIYCKIQLLNSVFSLGISLITIMLSNYLGCSDRFLGLITRSRWKDYRPMQRTDHAVYLKPSIYCVAYLFI